MLNFDVRFVLSQSRPIGAQTVYLVIIRTDVAALHQGEEDLREDIFRKRRSWVPICKKPQKQNKTYQPRRWLDGSKPVLDFNWEPILGRTIPADPVEKF